MAQHRFNLPIPIGSLSIKFQQLDIFGERFMISSEMMLQYVEFILMTKSKSPPPCGKRAFYFGVFQLFNRLNHRMNVVLRGEG